MLIRIAFVVLALLIALFVSACASENEAQSSEGANPKDLKIINETATRVEIAEISFTPILDILLGTRDL